MDDRQFGQNKPIPSFDPRWSKTDQRKRDDTRALGWKWSRLRAEYLTKFPYCQKCELLATQVHHIMPRATHPHLIFDWRNLMSICDSCHYKIHHGENTNENKQDNNKSK